MPRTVTPITPAEIVRSDGRRELYDSLVFANVTRIAKYGRLSFGLDGGLSEVVSCRIRDDQRCSLTDRRELLRLKPNSKITIDWPRTPHHDRLNRRRS